MFIVVDEVGDGVKKVNSVYIGGVWCLKKGEREEGERLV